MIRNDHQELFLRLRQQFPEFTYESFHYEVSGRNLSLSFHFRLGDKYTFHPHSVFRFGASAADVEKIVNQNRELVENIAFNIGMIELISYWKASCSPTVVIRPGALSDEQINWWKKLYFNGLGEFFYLNSIPADPDSFMQIKPLNRQVFRVEEPAFREGFLVPIGGGKDSAVSLSLLLNTGKPVTPLIMNPRGATIETVKAAGLQMENVLTISRTIDPLLIELNKQGFLNGHTPFSAMLAFHTLMCSAITGFANIVLSNEGSANESTIPGTGINHQYSKSFEFEQDFRNYYRTNICSGISYFSLLRPLSELQIAAIFSRLTGYHDVFRSCNAGSKTDEWCGKCPKCMFTHIMLSAFLGITEASRIIGNNMLGNPDNEEVFNELCGYSPIKPFDCVGTTLEVKQALQMTAGREPVDNRPYLLQLFLRREVSPLNLPDFGILEERHFVPDDLISVLKNNLR